MPVTAAMAVTTTASESHTIQFMARSCARAEPRGSVPVDEQLPILSAKVKGILGMPEKKTLRKARQDKREGKAPSTQAGEFVHEEIEYIRHGKHACDRRNTPSPSACRGSSIMMMQEAA